MTEVTGSQFRAMVQEFRSALTNVYTELHQLHDRLEDVSIFEKKAEFAAGTAETATIGVSELRTIINRAHERGARSVKLWVAALGSVSVIGVGVINAATSRANARLRLECAEVARQEIDRAELRNEARDARLAQSAADRALQARDRQLELLIKAGVK